ncbi:MAG: PDZ domain-containing protein [Clostridia bacterium]|nr:PDZ domain-containing protein [Clostridia bacterium]
MNNSNRKRLRRLLSVVLVLVLAVGIGTLTVQAAPAGGSPARDEVILGGMPFGVRFYTEGVLVVGFCDVDTNTGVCNPARDAGIRVRDVITHVGGKPLGSAAELTAAVESSGGRPLTLTVRRLPDKPVGKASAKAPPAGESAPEVLTLTVSPVQSRQEGRYKTGIWVKDSGAGIGTVTFIVPGTQAFAGLGHGICDGDTGALIPMGRGQVTDVTVSGIDKGVSGEPGAIKGYFNPGKTGTLVGNTPCGVFGIFTDLPSGADRMVTVAERNAVHEGAASILCTLDDGRIGEYAVNVSAVDRDASGSKCFAVTVTDPALLGKTGGIVQGMSGSPVMQDGKLIGAVTHVLINDPTTGYAIFIDNMWRDMPDLLK